MNTTLPPPPTITSVSVSVLARAPAAASLDVVGGDATRRQPSAVP